MAFVAASIARPSPEETPEPIKSHPHLSHDGSNIRKIEVIKPCTVIRSEIPLTAWSKTSSAF
jgi:hypothetical protein